jgi:ATP-dependent Clp protease ATP-binding subunit ClpA
MFTEECRRAIEFGHDAAHRLRCNYIDTGHLLLGILCLEESKAVAILKNAGVDSATLKQAIDEIYVALAPTGQEEVNLPLTARARKVLETAGQEARALKTQNIGTEHLLLALAKVEESIAAQILASFDLLYVDIYRGLHSINGENAQYRCYRLVEFSMTEVVRDIIQQAHARAVQYANDEMIISHLLLGITSRPDDPATRALTALGVNLQELRDRLEALIMLEGRARLRLDLVSCKIIVQRPLINRTIAPLSNPAKKILVESCEVMTNVGRTAVDTTCVLLAILGHNLCIPAQLLQKYNVTYETFSTYLAQNP